MGSAVGEPWSGSQKNGLASRVQTPVQSGTERQLNAWPSFASFLKWSYSARAVLCSTPSAVMRCFSGVGATGCCACAVAVSASVVSAAAATANILAIIDDGLR